MNDFKPKVLVVDDEDDIRDLVCLNLDRAGLSTLEAPDGIKAVTVATETIPDAIVLDLMMPGRDGFEVFRELRGDSRTKNIPVLMLTAKAQLGDKIRGLEIGADDYLTKPFSPKELVLRVQSLLKRSRSVPGENVIEVGPFRLDKNSLHFFLDGEKIEITPTEFKLLLFLAERQGQPQDRADLLREVWGYNDLTHSRTLDTHVRRVREKLGTHGAWIATARGIGYCFLEPED